MDFDKFKPKENPTLEDYVSMSVDDMVKYDFSNNVTDKRHKNKEDVNPADKSYSNIEDVMEKFIIYKAVHNTDFKNSNIRIMNEGKKYALKCKEEYGSIPDPDTGSKLLQDIYKKLWDEKILSYCKNKGCIMGDTINSASTTINQAFGCIETPEQKAERKKNNLSTKYIISRYNANNQFMKYFEQKGLNNYLSLYHTIGNFIPFPDGCNGPRGIGLTKDYWDIALDCIYNYYRIYGNISYLCCIVGNERDVLDSFRKWLDGFGDWDNFVKMNYLDDFVLAEEGRYHYGTPKQLWTGHMIDSILPENEYQCIEYFSNASIAIWRRGIRMAQALKDKVENEKK